MNAYGKDFEDIEYRFGDLMDDIHKIDIPRVRFTTSHPRDFDDHLIEVLAKGGNLVEHIHLPVQSEVRKCSKMSRKYTRETYLELAHKIKKAIPNVAFTTDIIVGFPVRPMSSLRRRCPWFGRSATTPLTRSFILLVKERQRR